MTGHSGGGNCFGLADAGAMRKSRRDGAEPVQNIDCEYMTVGGGCADRTGDTLISDVVEISGALLADGAVSSLLIDGQFRGVKFAGGALRNGGRGAILGTAAGAVSIVGGQFRENAEETDDENYRYQSLSGHALAHGTE